MNDNPYASPIAVDSKLSELIPTKRSLSRGAINALFWGVIGFLIIPGLKLSMAVFALYASGSRSDFRGDLQMLIMTLPGALILSSVFAGAAWANYVPARGLGFVRCLGIVAGATVVGAIIVSLLSENLGFGFTRRGAPLSHWAFFTLGSMIAPVLIGQALTWIRLSTLPASGEQT